uniref:Uncharacterized protein n=1 Tax=Brassica campestris TaxID=3711 RepID=A0A3P6ASM8_BRACM|nr:unnamed protein product [Brassica rapa]
MSLLIILLQITKPSLFLLVCVFFLLYLVYNVYADDVEYGR